MTLVPYAATPLARAMPLTALPEDELRRRAVTWARDREFDGLWQLTEAYLTVYGPNGGQVSAHTLRDYKRGVRVLLDEGQFDLLRPGRDAGALYLRSLENETASRRALRPSTVQNRLAAAKWLYRALRWAGATTADPFEHPRPVKDTVDPSDKRDAYTQDELERLLQIAGPRDRVIILLCAYAGLRNSEVRALRWDDIDFARQQLTVQRGKGRKPRSVTLALTLTRALRALPRRPDGLVIGLSSYGLRKRVRKLAVIAEIPEKALRGRGVHALRHYAGVRLIEETNDLDLVAQFLGHANIQTTRTYTKRADKRQKKSVGVW
ncbi:tyrosine-type recombinase/integrase [Deinococcus peraridilitoris]|uniref:Site-specific recombinase XerC n=1 Tax=Deinococcus peraridilitoris (strain DSM 19664 / LMG 22246 / CIP 109416 / KR-200) TaxID=937777 RepID=L0A836_DEIPD|nr:tyrosine-type recombinase/integrase [Deinococcus peraridilitoris]AFZ69347.1 site-specific recombinase XerC [Deinococcus peraridilitoris DSM 19664]